MKLRYLTADWIFPVHAAPLANAVLIIEQATGRIHDLCSIADVDESNVEKHEGAIVPGFINTHCHLELSHLKGRVDTHTGLLPFLQKVVKFRDVPKEQILQAIADADAEMYVNGIVAVGDISNVTDTAQQKADSPIQYTTFVELFDFWQNAGAADTYSRGVDVYNSFRELTGDAVSMVPHAPYTVSEQLMKLIRQHNADDAVVSIHNQETPAENELLSDKKGDFLEFYRSFGFGLDDFEATGKSSIHYSLQAFKSSQQVLLVHNTMTTTEDVAFANALGKQVYFASCPNANLYIENRLPDYDALLAAGAKMTLGTDSLSSNWQLSILEEMKAIASHKPQLGFDTLLKWATLHGAEALDRADTLGSLEIGKTPGLNLITGLGENHSLSEATKVRRLI